MISLKISSAIILSIVFSDSKSLTQTSDKRTLWFYSKAYNSKLYLKFYVYPSFEMYNGKKIIIIKSNEYKILFPLKSYNKIIENETDLST